MVKEKKPEHQENIVSHDEYDGGVVSDLATLKEKVRALEANDFSVLAKFVNRVDSLAVEVSQTKAKVIELEHSHTQHLEWSAQIPINYEKVNAHVRALEQTVKDGFAELKTQIKGQDKDFDYFVRLPAKTVLLGALGVLGVAVAHSFMRVVHWVWDWWKAFSKANYL